VTVAILRNGHEGNVFGFMMGFCGDGNLGEVPFPGDANFDQVTFPSTTAGAGTPCGKFQPLVTSTRCFFSINGLSAGDQLCLPDANGNQVCVPMEQVGGVEQRFTTTTPGIDVLVGIGIDATLCNGNGYWTRGPNNTQITMPGNVLMYHEIVGHGKHHCDGDFNSGDPEGQAIAEENILRAALGLETRTSHEGGCAGGGGGGGGCFIAGAAYGSQTAPEVQALRTIRDSVVRKTALGEAIFDEIYRQYYAISPPIAERISQDGHLREVVRAALVEPWSIALKLLLALPAGSGDAHADATFVNTAASAFAAWANEFPFEQLAPDGEVGLLELVAFLAAIPNRAVRSAILERLAGAGYLPVASGGSGAEAQLAALGLGSNDLALILGELAK